jgi:3-deoxy-7-phosphoheptulonate synthase
LPNQHPQHLDPAALERFGGADALPAAWSPSSWKNKLHSQQIMYPDRGTVERVCTKLAELPPLVTSWEIQKLKALIAQAQKGERFLLQGGDCAEQIDQCRPEPIASKLKILLQMSLVLIYASKKPVIRVGRFAGQYAKPRSSAEETRVVDGRSVTLPSYYGDLVNRPEFTPEARRPDPMRMLDGYTHAAMTLNFIRALMDGGFADLHHPEYWDLGFMAKGQLTPEMREQYQKMTQRLADGLKFMEAIGERTVDQLTSADFFTSHEALNLLYETAQTRTVPRRTGHYNLSTHMPWLGDRTRGLDGAHVEYFRGIRNPIGIKLGAVTKPEDVAPLVRLLNPEREPGKIALIVRAGAKNVKTLLPRLIEAVQTTNDLGPVLWMSDPMHGNTVSTSSGAKTRVFDDILFELESSWDIHERSGTRLGGIHIELTGEDVTECVGGAAGLTEHDLSRNYQSPCDPRLNYEQALELAFRLGQRMQQRADSRGAPAK